MEMYGYYFIREEDLKHYGLEGMHWGVRRWQNYDSTNSFNEAGIKRYFGYTPGRKSVAKKLGTEPSYKGDKKVYKYQQKSYKASSNIQDLKSNGTESGTFKNAYTMADKMSNFAFTATYGYTKNQAVQKLIKQNENNKIKYDKKIDRIEKSNSRICKLLGCSEEEAEQVRKVSKIIGISLATTAGLFAAAYLIKNRSAVQQIIKDPNAYFQILDGNYNKDIFHFAKPINLGDSLFYNKLNGDYLGDIARSKGFIHINGSDLRNILANPIQNSNFDFNSLVKNVRVNLVERNAGRRLSCWSASNSFYLSSLTGKPFASKSFENLVNFNDFGKLYTKAPKIFNINGESAKDFVGKFGTLDARASGEDAKKLISNIFKNINSTNNLAVDGKTTVGFINAGYHGATCTHQWNFELKDIGNGIKDLLISDGYSGERYAVGRLAADNSISYYSTGFSKLTDELHHYNLDSIRFYAPSLDMLNPDMLAKVVLGHI